MHYFVVLFRVLVNNIIPEIGTMGHVTEQEFCEAHQVVEKIKQQYQRGRTNIVSLDVTILSAKELTETEYHDHSSTFIKFS
ncbi:MAG: hypothetical protein EOP51_10510 [Sphingobacteriales bacterium]|nr:MAG: hypothetical protein EOP51_10510 [Sphingobacteriales bacterium]